MKAAIALASTYVLIALIALVLLTSTLKGCADATIAESESAFAYQIQFQNSNEHEVFVRRLGE